VGKGTVWVPAAHGSRREIDSDPEGVNRPASPPPPLRKNITPSRTLDPPRVGRSKDRQPWAAGINSIPLPTAIQGSPLRGSQRLFLEVTLIPRVQPKIWVKISRWGGESG